MQAIMKQRDRILDLIERVRRGDAGAFDVILNEQKGRLETFVRSRIRPELREQLDVEELAHETFSRAFESIERFEGADEDAWFAWLAGIAKNVVLKELEDLKRARAFRIDREPAADEVSPSRAGRRDERFRRLQDAMCGLPEDYRQVIQFCRIDGLRIRDAAERMDRSPDAVKKLLWRALRELKSSFGDTESLHLPRKPLDLRGTDDDR